MAERNKKCAIDITGERYGKLIALEPTEKRLEGSVIWKCLCNCGNITYVSINNLRGSKPVRSCGCGVRSIGESKIEEILKLNNINFISEYKIKEINQKRFDFYLPDFNRLIEYDGEQHFKDISNWDKLELQQKRDKIKNKYALAHNIPLVSIPYWERDNITLEMIMGDQYLIK